MADILHRIGIKNTTLEDVYQALTTKNGLADWWTKRTTGEGNQVGNIIHFRFDAGGFDMRVVELRLSDYVLWEIVAGPDEWMGTSISFELKQDGDYVILLFKHMNWKEQVEFMHHCSTKWAIFLMSLKSLLETGKGAPEPDDQKIDNWN
ncbi:MAG: SRPBCC domain-containing protein [Pedobacter sp.]|nr:MAG: SRPBCC domain-containing protein [Pedobacter sp.]